MIDLKKLADMEKKEQDEMFLLLAKHLLAISDLVIEKQTKMAVEALINTANLLIDAAK